MSTEQEASLQEIYNMLLAGEKIAMQFASKVAADRFRIRLQQMKRIQELAAISVGMMQPEERMQFSFTLDSPQTEQLPEFEVAVTATMQFKSKQPSVVFKIKRLDTSE